MSEDILPLLVSPSAGRTRFRISNMVMPMIMFMGPIGSLHITRSLGAKASALCPRTVCGPRMTGAEARGNAQPDFAALNPGLAGAPSLQ